MVEAKIGDRVSVYYKAFLKGIVDVSVPFDKTDDGKPLEFRVGDGKMIRGFEEAIVGMVPGEKKTVEIPPAKAYGEYRDDLEVKLDKSKLPSDVEYTIGQPLEICEDNDKVIPCEVLDVLDDAVIVNANHPLAGVELTFEIELVKIL